MQFSLFSGKLFFQSGLEMYTITKAGVTDFTEHFELIRNSKKWGCM